MICDIQKAGMWKRFSAYLFDVILLGIAAVGFAFLFSALLQYGAHTDRRAELQEDFEAKCGVNFDITQKEYDEMTEEERERYEKAYHSFVSDPDINALDALILNLTLIITAFGILAAYLILELLIPLKLKNGQTLGKKIFGVGLMRVDCVRISTLQLVVRTVLGKYTLETMLPVLLILMFFFSVMPLMCFAGLALLLLLQIVFVASSRYRLPIHDRIAGTVAVDLASQMIFDSAEEMTEYKKRLHAEAAERAEYR